MLLKPASVRGFIIRILVGMACLLCGCGGNQRVADGRLQFPTNVVDVGMCMGTNTARVAFPFRVVGAKPVSIVALSADCGCATVAAQDKSYAPGESGHVDMQLNVQGLVGPFVKHTAVRDSAGATVFLSIRGCTPGLVALDADGDYGVVPWQSAVTNTFRLQAYFPTNTPAKYSFRVGDGEDKRYRIISTTEHSATNHGQCEASIISLGVNAVGAELLKGRNDSVLRCELNADGKYCLTIPLAAIGRQDYEIQPEVLYVSTSLGKSLKGSQQTAPILVRIKTLGTVPEVVDVRLGKRAPKWDVAEREMDMVVVRFPDLHDLLMHDLKSSCLEIALKKEKIEIPIRRLPF